MTRVGIAAVCLALCACAADTGTTTEPLSFQFVVPRPKDPPPLDEQTQHALALSRLRADEILGTYIAVPLNGTGDTVVYASATNGQGGVRSFVVWPSGIEGDPHDVFAKNDADYKSHFGKMSLALFDSQSGLSDTDPVSFQISFTGPFESANPPEITDRLVSTTEFETWLWAHRDRQRSRIAKTKAAVMEWLASQGAVVKDYPSTPFADVTAPASALRSAFLNNHSSVAKLEEIPKEEHSQLLGFAGHGSMNEQNLTGGLCGGRCTGGTQKVGIWERDTNASTVGGIATGNTFYYHGPGTLYLDQPNSCTSDADCIGSSVSYQSCAADYVGGPKKCRGEHVSWVAAQVGMHGSYTYPAGVLGPSPVTFTDVGAWDVVFYVSDNLQLAGFDWFLNSAPTVFINHSQDMPLAGAMEWGTRFQNILFTQGSANSETGPATCAIWNLLCVGAYQYLTWNDLSTHRRLYGSSYINSSVIPGLERPHLLGPGGHTYSGAGLTLADIASVGVDGITSTAHDGSQIFGTSFASPAVASAALQAYQYEGYFSALAFPTMRKAVLMASSVDSNGDGPILKGYEWSQAVDGEDGAGHVDFTYIKQVLDGGAGTIGGFAGSYWWRDFVDSDFSVSCGTNCRKYTVGNITVPQGKRVRIAMVYNSCAPTEGATAVLRNNFDLIVKQPSACGRFAYHNSISLNSETEMIDDSCAPFGGTYTVYVELIGSAPLDTCGEAGEKVSIAWSLR